MALCASCGSNAGEVHEICSHHHMISGDNWAESNRIWCDYFHRGRVLERLTPEEYDADFRALTAVEATEVSG